MPLAAPFRHGLRRRSRRWRAGLVVAVVLVAAPLVAVVTLTGSSSPPTQAGAGAQSTTTAAAPAPPAPADIAAARACAAFTTYLNDAGQGRVPQAVGQAVTNAEYQLLAGASQDQAAGKPLPKWAALGQALVAATDDIVNRDSSALSKDGPAAVQACQSIPAAARVAGGYTPSANPASPSTTG